MNTAATEKRHGNDAAAAAVDDLKALIRDAEELLSNAGAAAGEQVNELRARLRQAMRATRRKFQGMEEVARERLEEADDYVRSHPYQSIGAAVALGALIGILLGRRIG